MSFFGLAHRFDHHNLLVARIPKQDRLIVRARFQRYKSCLLLAPACLATCMGGLRLFLTGVFGI